MIEKKTLDFEKTVLIGVITARQDEDQALEYLAELAFLAHTAGGEVIKQFTQKVTLPNPKTFIGSGKLNEIQLFVSENDVTTVVFDDEFATFIAIQQLEPPRTMSTFSKRYSLPNEPNKSIYLTWETASKMQKSTLTAF